VGFEERRRVREQVGDAFVRTLPGGHVPYRFDAVMLPDAA
jgi:hypothetical protein